MEKGLKKNIKDMILNKKIGSIDKIIGIYKLIEGDKNLGDLSKALDLSETFLSEWEPTEIPKDVKPTKSKLSQYIDIFCQYYKNIHNDKFDFDKKEIGQLNLCMKKFDLKKWEHVMILIEEGHKRIQSGKSYGTWKFIVDNLKPSIIYNQRNFISKEEIRLNSVLTGAQIKKKKWNW